MKGKAIGLGGVFIKFKDPEKMKRWYVEVLGLTSNDYGILFSFNDGSTSKGYLQLGTFPADSNYFGNDEQRVMLNFRVDDLNALVERLQSFGTPILNEIETYDFGKFLHISDPEGNRVELWEPVDESFSGETDSKMS